MKIRSHLLVMVVGALLPLLVSSTGLAAYSWWQERTALEFRQLERVRAITIALETELQASVRVLSAFALFGDLDAENLSASTERLQGVAAAQPLWTLLAAGDPSWQQVRVVASAGSDAPGVPAIHAATRQRVVESGLPVASPLVQAGGKYTTQIVVPMVRDGRVTGLLMAAIDQGSWRDFMSQYPIATGATMTLLDQDGRIIARTLDNERWVGKPPSPDLLRQTRERAEGAFRSTDLEGQHFYGAHSRSIRWGWTVATGLPAEAVEFALQDSSWMLRGTAIITILLTILLALMLGRRIERPISALGESARALERGAELPPPADGDIDEVQEVAHAFHAAAAQLSERERALNQALVREQQARLEAEQASAAKDEYRAMPGHELRNPLNALASAAVLFDRVDPKSSQAQRWREVIGRQVLNLRELVNNLLDVARVTRGMITFERTSVDVADIARRTVAAMASSGRLGTHEVEADCREAWAHGDATRIEQMLTNLLDNASKYTHDGGRITVRTRTEGSDAVIQVEDNGMGIAPELLPRVFDLFTQGSRTLDRPRVGSGSASRSCAASRSSTGAPSPR